MKERPEAEYDPYWTADIGLFEGRFRYARNEPMIVRARIHRATERYSADNIHPDIVPVAQQDGSRSYLHLQPYLLLPDIRLTVGLSPTPQPSSAIGEVVAAEEAGYRREWIGTAQMRMSPQKHRSDQEAYCRVPQRLLSRMTTTDTGVFQSATAAMFPVLLDG